MILVMLYPFYKLYPMVDTHAHLNFDRFKKSLHDVMSRAEAAGVQKIIVPGTDVTSSKMAVALAGQYENLYAAVGIHPHHVFELRTKELQDAALDEISTLMKEEKVVALGEVGLDRHEYNQTKYHHYLVEEDFVDLQKKILVRQLGLAIELGKPVILHNREATDDLLELLAGFAIERLPGLVFHCCEPQDRLLAYAMKNGIYIGVDGDVTYDLAKQEFIRKVPLEILLLETDSPFILPEPLKTERKYPNEPANTKIIAEFVAGIKSLPTEKVIDQTTMNAQKVFDLSY